MELRRSWDGRRSGSTARREARPNGRPPSCARAGSRRGVWAASLWLLAALAGGAVVAPPAPLLAKSSAAPKRAPAPAPRPALARLVEPDTLGAQGSEAAEPDIDYEALERSDPGGDRVVAGLDHPGLGEAAAAAAAPRASAAASAAGVLFGGAEDGALAAVIVPEGLRAPLNIADDPLRDRGVKLGPLPLKPRSGAVGYALVDVRSRRVLAGRNLDRGFVPASVAKAPTALYALASLGPSHRFETQLRVVGVVQNGVLQGDLYLVGSGDPALDTGDLADLARALLTNGVKRVAGKFYYDASAAPTRAQIEPSQPVQAAYNPAVSGLNLNYNRVLMKWRRIKRGVYDFDLDAHAARYSTPARDIEVGLKRDGGKNGVFRYERRGGIERWGVAQSALGRRGQRWFPVQRPAAYAANAFRDVGAKLGVTLPAPRPGQAPDSAAVLAAHQSPPLSKTLKRMLKYSTNITAEAVGLAATRARGLEAPTLEESGRLMSDWMDEAFGLAGQARSSSGDHAALVNHSGLASDSRLSPRAMAAVLANVGAERESYDLVAGLLAPYRFKGMSGKGAIAAKTGTMYFGRGLTGYITCKRRDRRLAFVYLHSDIAKREAYDRILAKNPNQRSPGGSAWLSRARTIERRLLNSWIKAHC